jgi:hypothetical protein
MPATLKKIKMIIVSSIGENPNFDERQIDEYVPVSYRSYPGLMGAKYLRVGNFKTALLEFLLDPISYTIRGITLLSFDRVHIPIDFQIISESSGLPIIDIQKSGFDGLAGGDNKADLNCKISVGLTSNCFEIDFFGIENSNRKINCGRSQFFLKNEVLTGIRFVNLLENEFSILKNHLAFIR